jgi:hypothetical protein
MAKGYSNRARLSLPPATTTELETITRPLERWANNLPFASVGFYFSRTTNESATANLAATTITWNNAILDHENWMPTAGTVQSIVVPAGLSGLYAFRFAVYWATATTGMIPFLRINGTTILTSDVFQVANDKASCLAFSMLNDGDVITAGLSNASGSARTITAFGATSLEALLPTLQAWRISLQ